jgi:serine/threonine protein kinase
MVRFWLQQEDQVRSVAGQRRSNSGSRYRHAILESPGVVCSTGVTVAPRTVCKTTHACLPSIMLLSQGKRSTASDMYAFGVTLFEIFSGQMPYETYDTPMSKQSALSSSHTWRICDFLCMRAQGHAACFGQRYHGSSSPRHRICRSTRQATASGRFSRYSVILTFTMSAALLGHASRGQTHSRTSFTKT